MEKRRFKWCFVPYCSNNNRKTPDKIFLSVPSDPRRKTDWFGTIGEQAPTTTTTYYCCEDHFNLEEDAANYMQNKLMGARILLKSHIVPHIFSWPRGLKRPSFETPSSGMHTKFCHSSLPSTSSTSEVIVDNVQNIDITCAGTSGIKCSVGVQAKPYMRSKYVSCHLVPNVSSIATSPIKLRLPTVSPRNKPCEREPSASEEEKEVSEFLPSSSTSGQLDIQELLIEDKKAEEQSQSLNVVIKIIENNPKRYLGVPKKWYDILLKLLCQHGTLKKQHVLLSLMKIKTNDSFARLGDQFGLSSSAASKIFKTNIATIAHLLKPLVYWPEEKLIKNNLPIPFRARYYSVQSIIDCLEIEIEKPTDPMKQALTWSEYKKCNTFKYLISCTPDGFINFVSNGFGGRISDVLLLEQCNYINVVPHGCAVMADKGFKHVDNLLKEKNCQLIKPPSVSSSTKPSKAEVIESKRIASLRIHVERLIRRLREFAYLKPHAVINHQMLATLMM